jgi:hypothetical protein
VQVFEDEAKKHSVTVVVGVDGSYTTVSVTYANSR